MYQNINEQFASTARQFADTAAQVNRLALAGAEKAFGLQLSTLEQNTNAAFAFWGELVEARDMDAVKSLWPKGVQVARENLERSIGATQEVLGNAMNANESIGQIAKGQFDAATAQASAEVEKATAEVQKAAKKATRR